MFGEGGGEEEGVLGGGERRVRVLSGGGRGLFLGGRVKWEVTKEVCFWKEEVFWEEWLFVCLGGGCCFAEELVVFWVWLFFGSGCLSERRGGRGVGEVVLSGRVFLFERGV